MVAESLGQSKRNFLKPLLPPHLHRKVTYRISLKNNPGISKIGESLYEFILLQQQFCSTVKNKVEEGDKGISLFIIHYCIGELERLHRIGLSYHKS